MSVIPTYHQICRVTKPIMSDIESPSSSGRLLNWLLLLISVISYLNTTTVAIIEAIERSIEPPDIARLVTH